MRTPNLNTLRMFDAAARHGSFARAADELHLTQGAVAQRVRQLEADLGQPLFSRLPRGLTLTTSGALYHKEIRKALALIDQASRALTPETQKVTLSVPPSFATKWLVPRLAAFAASHPAISLDLRASETLTNFATDDIDMVIRQGPHLPHDGLKTLPLAPLSLCAVAQPGTAPLLSVPEDFQSYPLIEDGHRHWHHLFETHDLAPPKAALQFNQTALAIDAAIAGQGIAMAPELLIIDALDKGDLAVIWRAPSGDHSYHILHPDRPHPARDAVIAWLQTQIS